MSLAVGYTKQNKTPNKQKAQTVGVLCPHIFQKALPPRDIQITCFLSLQMNYIPFN